MNHTDPSATYLDPMPGHLHVDLWGLLDSVVGNVSPSLYIEAVLANVPRDVEDSSRKR